MQPIVRFFLALSLVSVILTACQSAPASPTPDLGPALTQAVATALAQLATPTFTPSPVPTATVARTPPPLPALFTTTLPDPLVKPNTYIQDACQYLKDKWTPTNAAPGTIVMAVMIHSITKGTITDPLGQISVQNFKQLMNDLHEQGFTAITAQQLVDFLYTNAKIPERSVILIQDDRKTAENFTEHFLPYYQQWGWPVVNGWISLDDSIGRQYLPENVALSKQGWVDYEAHGVVHNVPISSTSSDEYMRGELFGSMQAIQKNFGKTPVAYIWPGGGFTPKAVQLARQAGYKIGFTTSPRGPMMFNWIPQRDQDDPQNPWYIAEGSSGDPLMTLPRYYDSTAGAHIDEARQIGQQAAAYAEQNKATELDYYNIVCAAKYGAIPAQ